MIGHRNQGNKSSRFRPSQQSTVERHSRKSLKTMIFSMETCLQQFHTTLTVAICYIEIVEEPSLSFECVSRKLKPSFLQTTVGTSGDSRGKVSSSVLTSVSNIGPVVHQRFIHSYPTTPRRTHYPSSEGPRLNFPG